MQFCSLKGGMLFFSDRFLACSTVKNDAFVFSLWHGYALVCFSFWDTVNISYQCDA